MSAVIFIIKLVSSSLSSLGTAGNLAKKELRSNVKIFVTDNGRGKDHKGNTLPAWLFRT